MAADTEDQIVEAGSDWDLKLVYRHKNADGTPGDPIDVTGFNLVLEVRFNNQTGSATPSFSVSTLAQGSIPPEIVVSDGPAGEFTLHVPASRTSTLPPNTWTKSFSGTPNTHYTARIFAPDGQERFALTGDLTIRPA